MQCKIKWLQMSGCRCGMKTEFFSRGVTHDWISSVFEVLLLFWLVIICLLSSLDDIDVRVKLLADDVREAEYNKTGFFSVGVDSFNHLFLRNDQLPSPWWKILIKIENMINEDKWESSTNRKMRNNKFWWMVSLFLVRPSLWKRSRTEKC